MLRNVTETTPGNAAASLRYYRRKRFGFLAAGLNTRGKAYRRRAFLTEEDRRQYNLAKWHRRAERLAAAGLTTRGTVPRFRAEVSGFERAWAEFRAGMKTTESTDYES